MFTKQKIKRLIVIFSVVLALTLTCVFHSDLHPFFINVFTNKFNIVTSKNNLVVHFISVGQADAIAINLPDDKIMLIDAGSEYYNATYVKYLKENVLNSKRNNYIDYLVLTHADADHVGGTLKLLKNFSIGTIFMPKIASETETYEEIYNFVTKNCNYKYLGDRFYVTNNKYMFTFFEIVESNDANETSQLIKLEFMGKSFLFTGDISAKTELIYVAGYGNCLDCDVLKVAHHGSKTSSCEEFLDVVSPKYAVISVSENNMYGHPNSEVVENLNNVGAKILRTDKQGDIIFAVGENYNLVQLNNSFYITNMSLNYVLIVIVLDVCLLWCAIIVIIKKGNKKIK